MCRHKPAQAGFDCAGTPRAGRLCAGAATGTASSFVFHPGIPAALVDGHRRQSTPACTSGLKLYNMVVSASSIRDMSTDEKLPRADSDGSLASIDDATNHAEYKVRRSRLIGMVNWWHVAMTFYPRDLVSEKHARRISGIASSLFIGTSW